MGAVSVRCAATVALLVTLLHGGAIPFASSETATFANAFHRLLSIDPGENYLFYAPHDGFGNQAIAFRNVLRVAGILNRTLIVPPILGHYDVKGGDCVIGEAKTQDEYREMAWRAISRKLDSTEYVSLADVVDLSKLPEGLVRTIDLRLFAALHCGVNVSRALSLCDWCKPLLEALTALLPEASGKESQGDLLEQCGILLGALGNSPTVSNSLGKYDIYRVKKSCHESVFTYTRNENGELGADLRLESDLSFKCEQGKPTYVNHKAFKLWMKRYKSMGKRWPEPVNIELYLGSSDSETAKAKVINFGSTFNYFELDPPLGDDRIDAISCATEFMGFTRPIMDSAKLFAKEQLGEDYACLHFRGGDGYYWEAREVNRNWVANQLRRLHAFVQSGGGGGNLTLFLMSDLTSPEWVRKFEGKFGVIGFDIRMATELRSVEEEARMNVLRSRLGVFTNRVDVESTSKLLAEFGSPLGRGRESESEGRRLPRVGETQDMSLHLEQAVCSCANLGFVGDQYSTLTKAVFHMRSGNTCGSQFRAGTDRLQW